LNIEVIQRFCLWFPQAPENLQWGMTFEMVAAKAKIGKSAKKNKSVSTRKKECMHFSAFSMACLCAFCG